MSDADFESRLAAQLRRFASLDPQPADAIAAAEAAMGGGRAATPWLRRWTYRQPALAWLATVLVAIALAIALLAGLLLASGMVRLPRTGRLAFIRAGDVYLAAADGTAQRRLASGGANAQHNGFERLALAPDGHAVAAILDDLGQDPSGNQLPEKVEILADDGSLIGTFDIASVAPTGYQITRDISWSPDGQHLAVLVDAGSDPVRGLYVIDRTGHLERQLPLPGQFVSFSPIMAWSPDGRSILITGTPGLTAGVKWEPGLWIVAADGSVSRQLVDGRLGGSAVWAAAWSPDSQRIVYVFTGNKLGRPPSEVRVISIANGVSQELPNADLAVGLAWSPDGRLIALATQGLGDTAATELDSLDVVASDGSAGPRQLVGGRAVYPSVAPDGSVVGTPTYSGEVMSTGLGWWDAPSWSGDSSAILYRSSAAAESPIFAIRTISVAGGPSRVLVDNVDNFDYAEVH